MLKNGKKMTKYAYYTVCDKQYGHIHSIWRAIGEKYQDDLIFPLRGLVYDAAF